MHVHRSALRVELNGVPVFRGVLPDHPHDARGALSYLRGDGSGGTGAYGYLVGATVEGETLRRVIAGGGGGVSGSRNHLRVVCAVPEREDNVAGNMLPDNGGGLVLYGPECGRYPFGLTVVVER